MKERLTGLTKGQEGRIEGIQAGRRATKRLYEMGFHTGARVRIAKNDAGPVIVSFRGNKIALGRGLASKIEVSRIGAEAEGW